jgi:hypothetical protein
MPARTAARTQGIGMETLNWWAIVLAAECSFLLFGLVLGLPH